MRKTWVGKTREEGNRGRLNIRGEKERLTGHKRKKTEVDMRGEKKHRVNKDTRRC